MQITPELLRRMRHSYSPYGSYTEAAAGACDLIDILLRVLGEDPKKRWTPDSETSNEGDTA